MSKLLAIRREGQFQIIYVLENGVVAGARVDPAFADFVMKAWEKRNAAGYMKARTPKGELSKIYIVPTTDGVSLMVQPKRPLKIVHSERENSQESIVQVTLEDEDDGKAKR